MTADRPWQTTLQALLVRPSPPRVLLHETPAGPALPGARLEGGRWDVTAEQTRAALSTAVGAPINLLDRVARSEDEVRRAVTAVFAVEPRDGQLDLVGGDGIARRWVDRAALSGLPLADEAKRALISDRLAEVGSGHVPAARPPWARRGWYATAEAWIAERLTALGCPPTGPIRPERTWCLSCVLCVPTAAGRLFFKTGITQPLFVNEAAVTAGLARLYPKHVPAPLAADVDRGWMLLPDLGPTIGHDASVDERAAMLRQFARVQRDAAGRRGALQAAGCLDRGLARLSTAIAPLVTAPELEETVAPEVVERLHALAPQLRDMCAALAACAVPETLVHGDLHAGNVARSEGRLMYFDWTDACISHPFFDLLDVFHERDPAVRAELRAAYLAPWLEGYTMTELEAAWRLAEPLAAVHHAQSYVSILRHVERSGWADLAWALPFWAKQIVAGVDRATGARSASSA